MTNFEISETRNCHSELIWLTLPNKKVPNFRIDIFCDTAPMTWPFLHLTNKKIFSHFESNFPTLLKTLNTAVFNTYKANDDKKWRFSLSHENSALSWISQRFTWMRRYCNLTWNIKFSESRKFTGIPTRQQTAFMFVKSWSWRLDVGDHCWKLVTASL